MHDAPASGTFEGRVHLLALRACKCQVLGPLEVLILTHISGRELTQRRRNLAKKVFVVMLHSRQVRASEHPEYGRAR